MASDRLHFNLPETWAQIPTATRRAGKEILREYTSSALLVFADLLSEYVKNELVAQYWRVVGEVLGALEIMAKDPLMRGSEKRFSGLERSQREGVCAFVTERTKFELHWLVGPRGGLSLQLKRPDVQMPTTVFWASRHNMNNAKDRFEQARGMAMCIRMHNKREETSGT